TAEGAEKGTPAVSQCVLDDLKEDDTLLRRVVLPAARTVLQKKGVVHHMDASTGAERVSGFNVNTELR
ncbi:unnamed protein product, partial [Amoebophrya sp. A120]